jgi:hypothetical protein
MGTNKSSSVDKKEMTKKYERMWPTLVDRFTNLVIEIYILPVSPYSKWLNLRNRHQWELQVLVQQYDAPGGLEQHIVRNTCILLKHHVWECVLEEACCVREERKSFLVALKEAET